MLLIGLYDDATEKEKDAVWLSAEYVSWLMLLIGLYDDATEKEKDAVWLSAEYVSWFWLSFLKDMHNFTPEPNMIGGENFDTTSNTLGKEKRTKTKKTQQLRD